MDLGKPISFKSIDILLVNFPNKSLVNISIPCEAVDKIEPLALSPANEVEPY